MKKLLTTIIICCICMCLQAENASDTSTSKPANNDIDQLLEKIESSCSQLQSFQADMNYDILQSLIDSETVRTGKLYYKTLDGGVVARIHFDDLTEIDLMADDMNPAPVVFDEDFYFDGLWVIRCNAQTKTVQKWEVSKDRQNREAFRLGHGPFPLPFAIKKQDVLTYFKTELMPAKGKAAKTETHLKLTPVPDSSYAEEYRVIDIWFDNESYIPNKIRYLKQDYEENTVVWTNINTKDSIKDSIFEAPKTPSGWSEEVTKLKEAKPELSE